MRHLHAIARVSFKTFEIWNDQSIHKKTRQRRRRRRRAKQKKQIYSSVKKERKTMDSCFPPLANLSLRGSSRSNKPNKNRHSTDGSAHNDSHLFYHQNNDHLRNHSEIMPKLEVLQDLDLYYVRQIASSLKVKQAEQTQSHDPILFCFFYYYYC